MTSRVSLAASDELVALCQAQVYLLMQAAGGDWCAVYLTAPETVASSPELIPVAIYPENSDRQSPLTTPESSSLFSPPYPPLPADRGTERDRQPLAARELPRSDYPDPLTSDSQQFVLPLLHEGNALGLLVARRHDRTWNHRELAIAERVARTLALASWLHRQQQWYRERLAQREHTMAQQRDRLGDLLHQLRNPLTALRTFGKLLLKRLQANDTNRPVVESLVGESDRLQDLLREFDLCIDAMALEPPILPERPQPKLLPPSRETTASSGLLHQTALPLEPLALAAVLQPLTQSAAAIAQERHLCFQSDIPTNLLPAHGNARALREVFSNLIDNALKYTPSGGSIRLAAGLEHREAGLSWQGTAISDTGIGIPADDRAHLFERHYRGVQAAGDIEGSGLGLAIAHELVAEMGGRIELNSPLPEAERQALDAHTDAPGTQFIVWLPVTPNTPVSN
ncbi:MAG: GAF domain-containing sensor histidine kinase [Spirulinaceae cyanobacterium RM2_2_10]|nr:GAF domain-containing sensor histidine kinase [Spirulinaceae cyanobacterium SM2_1_0]NJO20443.1 GAF domain-containing sensor histidine kinase [Spirulinaceae cyanobacterium RM2_2_10]